MKLSKFAFIGTASLLTLSLAAPSIFADGPEESEATITFTSADDAPPVYDPENPGTILSDEELLEEGSTGQTGPLTLDYVSSIEFGEQEISLDEASYEAVTPSPFIQVTDRRGGGGLGWDVTASATPFTAEDGTATLNGAVLSFTNGDAVAGGDYEFDAPEVNDTISIPTDGTTSATVASASAEAEGEIGLGAWLVRWLDGDGESEGNSNVTLAVPAGAATDAEFESTITWTLSATPTE